MHASLNASLRVGCAWQVLAKSSDAAPYSMPSTPSAIISPAFGPMMCTPGILSVVLSARTFTNPSELPVALARARELREHTLIVLHVHRLPHRRHLRERVYHPRDGVVIDVPGVSRDRLHRGDALLLGLVREHRPVDAVADGVYARHRRAEVRIHVDPAESGGVRPASGGDKYYVVNLGSLIATLYMSEHDCSKNTIYESAIPRGKENK